MLFDWRVTISRKDYWVSLLFLFIFLQTTSSILRWKEYLRVFFDNLGIERANDTVIDVSSGGLLGFLDRFSPEHTLFIYFFNSIFTIFYLFTIVALISIVIITIKRARTLQYSTIKGCLFTVVTYFASFTSLSIYNIFTFGNREVFSNFVPILIFLLLLASGVVCIVLLSKKGQVDEKGFFDCSKKQANAIFKLFGLTVFYASSFYLVGSLKIQFLDSNPLIRSIMALVFIVVYLCFYLKIFLNRSTETNTKKVYFISLLLSGLFFSIVAALASNKQISPQFSNTLLGMLLNNVSFLFLNILAVYSYVLIALPDKENSIVAE